MLLRLSLGILAAVACTTASYGQAAVEYALKTSGSAASASGSAIIAGCRVDTTLLTCLSRSYPKATIVAGALLALLIYQWLARRR